MPAHDQYTSLELSRLLAQVANHAGSGLTRELITNIEVVFHPSRVDENLDQTTEAHNFLLNNPSVDLPGFSALTDLSELWDRIYAGELIDTLQARSLLSFFSLCAAFSGLRKKLPLGAFPRLSDVASAWQPQDHLHSQAKRIFSDEGEVRDSASPALKRIREDLRKFESRVGRDVRDMLHSIKEDSGEDALLSLRGNRFVVLMPKSLARSYEGNIVDISGSGQSIYFEPRGIGKLNAERQHLFLDEDQEVRKVLREFGILVSANVDSLKANLAILAQYDYIFARAKFANAIQASRPKMVHEGGFELEAAIHPLLFKNFVPEQLKFDREKALIISGVNAGGKTVLLKLLGLYSLMAALGCYVPGQAQLPYVSGIHADIGDDQSTLHNLSTFTAHLHFLTQLWESLKKLPADHPPLLVLVDEIGTGTEPGEGAAFAYGLICTLLDHNVKLAVTTHYDILKTLAFEHDTVKNVCLEFDQLKLRPTFRVLDNLPGQSFALAIARRWGIDPTILAYADSVLGSQEKKMATVIGELETLRKEALDATNRAQEREHEISLVQADNQELTRELGESKLKFSKQAEKIKAEMAKRIDELLTETKQKLKRKARQSSRRQDDFVKAASKSAAVARRQKSEAEEQVDTLLAQLEISALELETTDEPIIVGDLAVLEGSAIRGRVVGLKARKGEAVLEVHGKRMTLKLNRLQKVLQESKGKSLDPLAAFQKAAGLGSGKNRLVVAAESPTLDSLDLHGFTVEEAREELEAHLSHCLQGNIEVLHIQHGVGTGRLRAFVQDFLRTNIHIASFSQAAASEGGVGVTVARLK